MQDREVIEVLNKMMPVSVEQKGALTRRYIDSNNPEVQALKIAIEAIKSSKEYRETGTSEEFRILKKRSIPLEPENIPTKAYQIMGKCPVCECTNANTPFCQKCGQALVKRYKRR